MHSVAFSPSGDALAFVAHDSSVTVVYPSAPDQPPRAVVTVTTQMLPFVSLCWTREDQLVAAGHDCHPVVFQGSVDGWAQAYAVDDPNKARKGEAQESSALNMFRQMDLKGKNSSEDTNLKTIHQNSISTLRAYEGAEGNITKFSSSGYFSPPLSGGSGLTGKTVSTEELLSSRLRNARLFGLNCGWCELVCSVELRKWNTTGIDT